MFSVEEQDNVTVSVGQAEIADGVNVMAPVYIIVTKEVSCSLSTIIRVSLVEVYYV